MITMSKVYYQLSLFKVSKVCSKCHIEKPLNDFPKNRRHADGHSTQCKACGNAYEKAHRDRVNERRRQPREEYVPVLSQTCIVCHIEKLISEFHKSKREKTGYRYECKTCRVEEARVYNLAHCEQKRAHNREYRKRNPRVEYCQRWYRANYERLNMQHRIYYETHAGAQAIRARIYRVNHRLQETERVRRRRILQKGNTVSRVSYNDILERDGRWCYICEQDILPHHKIHFDHVIPVIRGGAHAEFNIKPTHTT